MGILTWIVFGFFVGLIARAVMPGRQSMGFIKTVLLGVGGSFVGGTIATAMFHFPLLSLHPAGFLGSVVGALLIMVVAGVVGDRS